MNREKLTELVNERTVVKGGKLQAMHKRNLIIDSEVGRLTIEQAWWYLEHDTLEVDSALVYSPETSRNLSDLKLVTKPSDTDLMQMVERNSKVRLADLYKKGKARGLIAPTHKGYA